MDIGLTLVADATGRAASDALESVLHLCETAQHRGIKTLWFTEHHHNRTRALSSIPVLMAAAGARTGLKLGAATLLPALHDPVRLAEAMGSLEALYPGRMLWGFGKGGRSEVACTHLSEITPDNVRDRMLDAVDALYAPEPECAIVPPLSSTTPRFIASRDAGAVRYAAQNGMGLMFGHKWPLEALAGLISLYRSHHPEGSRPRVMLSRYFHCESSDAEARRVTLDAFERRREKMRAIGRAQATEAEGVDFGRSLVGTPDACRERIAHYGGLGITHLSLRPALPSTEAALRSLEALAL